MDDIKGDTLEDLALRMPNHIVMAKRLWVGNISVDINHIDNDLNKPLNYIDAFKEMAEILDGKAVKR
jgi:hypothetical protein